MAAYQMPFGTGTPITLQLAGIQHILGVLRRQQPGHVGIAPLQQRPARGRGGDVPRDDPAHRGLRAARPVLVADVDRLGAGLPALHLEAAGPGDVVLQPFLRPRIAGAVLGREFAVDHVGDGDAEVRHQQLVLADEVDPEGLVVDGDELLWLLHAAGGHLRAGEPADADGTVERPFHVLRRDWTAGMELRVAQLEGDAHAVTGFLPAFRQLWLQLMQGEGLALIVRQRDRFEADQSVVAVERHTVHRLRGAQALHVHAVRPVFLHQQQRLRPGRRLCLGRGAGDEGRSQGGCRGGEEATAIHGRTPIGLVLALVQLRKDRALAGSVRGNVK